MTGAEHRDEALPADHALAVLQMSELCAARCSHEFPFRPAPIGGSARVLPSLLITYSGAVPDAPNAAVTSM
jgi:hypothetical protein